MSYGIADDFGVVPQSSFGQDMCAVGADSLHAQKQAGGDAGHALTLGQPEENLELPIRKRRVERTAGALGQLGRQEVGEIRADEAPQCRIEPAPPKPETPGVSGNPG